MVDREKHVQHWCEGAVESWRDSEAPLQARRFTFAAFAFHLALEKELKARVVAQTGSIPPRIHNLVRLAELAGLALSDEQKALLAELNMYQMVGHYQDLNRAAPNKEQVMRDFARAQEFFKWLHRQ